MIKDCFGIRVIPGDTIVITNGRGLHVGRVMSIDTEAGTLVLDKMVSSTLTRQMSFFYHPSVVYKIPVPPTTVRVTLSDGIVASDKGGRRA